MVGGVLINETVQQDFLSFFLTIISSFTLSTSLSSSIFLTTLSSFSLSTGLPYSLFLSFFLSVLSYCVSFTLSTSMTSSFFLTIISSFTLSPSLSFSLFSFPSPCLLVYEYLRVSFFLSFYSLLIPS